jgi:hypothetical protein
LSICYLIFIKIIDECDVVKINVSNTGFRTVLISGAGEIGSRHLQSMVSCALPLTVYLHSDNPKSLENCQQRWIEANGEASPHRLRMCYDLADVPQWIDLAIVASTSSSRLLLVEAIVKRSQVRYWLLEKVVAQSATDVERMLGQVGVKGSRSWVNYYMQAQGWYADIKSHLLPRTPKHMTVTGGAWGLACNSLHFIHLHGWFCGSQLVSLNADKLTKAWHESKRPDNWEIYGGLEAVFSDDGRLELLSTPGPVSYALSLTDGAYTWQIDEQRGVALRSDGFEVLGRVPYQSERTLVEEILIRGDCRLPTFAEIAAADQLFISTMLNHWRQYMDRSAQLVPIT